MTTRTPRVRSKEALDTVVPELRVKLWQMITAMETLGWDLVAISGLRTAEQQQALYAKGRTTPGPKVTNCDGIAKRSPHQSGMAVDCCFVKWIDPPATPGRRWEASWDGPWTLYGAMAVALGLAWGGNNHTFIDRPHVELQ